MLDSKNKELLIGIIESLASLVNDGDTEVNRMPYLETEVTNEAESIKYTRPSSNNQEEKREVRPEMDEMDDPPISDEIFKELNHVMEILVTTQRGLSLNCIVIGEYTGMLSSSISDSFGGSGGRVLCIGDCVDVDGHPIESWTDYVGERFQKTVWPVKGHASDDFQGIDRQIDLVLLSTCGSYLDMATLISKWMGFLRPGGIICGTQLEEGHYSASVNAIYEVLGKENINCLGSSLWWKQFGSVKAKS